MGLKHVNIHMYYVDKCKSKLTNVKTNVEC